MNKTIVDNKIASAFSLVLERQEMRDEVICLLKTRIGAPADEGSVDNDIQNLLMVFLDLNTKDYLAWAELSALFFISSGRNDGKHHPS